MANIKRKIENLKPGKEYLLTVRAKNADLNVKSDYTDTVRFVVPQDSTIPNDIDGLELYASFQKVMFKFNYSSDPDIDQYEYELYDLNDLENGNKVSSGFNSANVFTIAVENSYMTDDVTPTVYDTVVPKSYWGRVRGIDTTGNAGPWTVLVETNTETPLIEEQFIDSLTASKITAGIIGAQTITLNGANSILKSTNFNGTLSSPGNYTGATQGWLINGIGNAYFGNADIRGSVSASEFNLLDNNGQVVGQLGQVETLNFGSYDHGLLFNNLDSRTGQNAGIGWTTHNFMGNISITNAVNNTPSAGLVTCYVSSHNFSIGDYVYISGVNPSSLLSDGYYLVFGVASGSFSVVAPSATGTYTSGGTVFWGYNHYLSIVGPSQTSRYPAEFRLYNDYNESSGYQLIAGSKAIGTWTEINSTYDAAGSTISFDARAVDEFSSLTMTSGGSPGIDPDITLTTGIGSDAINNILLEHFSPGGTGYTGPFYSQMKLNSKYYPAPKMEMIIFSEASTSGTPGNDTGTITFTSSDSAILKMNDEGRVSVGPGAGLGTWSIGSPNPQTATFQVTEVDASNAITMALRHTSRGSATGVTSGLDFTILATDGSAYIINREATTLSLRTSGTDRLVIAGNGVSIRPGSNNSTSLGTSSVWWSNIYSQNALIVMSDLRSKKDIYNSDLGLEFIDKLRPVKYNYIIGSNIVEKNDEDLDNPNIISVPGTRIHYGLIAQEVKEVLDQMNVSDFGGWVLTDLQNADSNQGLRYEEFIAPIIKAIQELSDKITVIENHLGL